MRLNFLWETDVCAHTNKIAQKRAHFEFESEIHHQEQDIMIFFIFASRIFEFSSICLRLQRARSRRSVGVRQRTWAFLIPTHPETFISGVGRGPR